MAAYGRSPMMSVHTCDPVMASGVATTSAVGRSPRWYAVQCQAHREGLAARELSKQGLCTFHPLRPHSRRHARKIEVLRSPLFPGYIFVSLALARDRWRSVNGTLGVIRIVSFGDSPCPVPEGIVEALIARCDADGLLNGAETLTVGTPAKVLAGPFVDFVGTIQCLDGRDRVRLLMEFLGAAVSVRINRRFVAN